MNREEKKEGQPYTGLINYNDTKQCLFYNLHGSVQVNQVYQLSKGTRICFGLPLKIPCIAMVEGSFLCSLDLQVIF